MPSIIRVAWRSENPAEEIRGSYDLGRELIALGMRLQADGADTWATTDGGTITDIGRPIGDWRVETASRQTIGGDRCHVVPGTANGIGLPHEVDLIEHECCNEYRDGVITRTLDEGNVVVFEPTAPTQKGRVRV